MYTCEPKESKRENTHSTKRWKKLNIKTWVVYYADLKVNIVTFVYQMKVVYLVSFHPWKFDET